jgi:hypothetical protein
MAYGLIHYKNKKPLILKIKGLQKVLILYATSFTS